MMALRSLLLAALLLLAGPGWAQAPSPVPALPDSARLTTYSLSSSVCTCSVGFALFGSGVDVDEWIQVFVGGVAKPSTDPTYGWSLSIPVGTLASAARPITNAILTFNAAQTATVVIVGNERPRRLSQFPEARGVAARDLNQAITDAVAVQRELWDKLNRAIVGQPGEVLLPLSSAASRAGLLLGFDANGNPVPTAVSNTLATNVANNWSVMQTFSGFATGTSGVSIYSTGRIFAGPVFTNYWPISPTNYISMQPIFLALDTYGTGAVGMAMRSSDWSATYPPNGGGNISQVFTEAILTVHDRTTSGPFAVWGNYSQFVRTAAALTSIGNYLAEYSFVDLNSGGVVAQDPYNWNNGGATHLLRIDSGVGTSNPLGVGQAVSSALEIINNGAQFYCGICFGYNAIATETITSASHILAIGLPDSNEIVWFHAASPSNTGTGVTSSLTASIFTDASSIFNVKAVGGFRVAVNGSNMFDCNVSFTNFCEVTASAGLVSGDFTNTGAQGYKLVNGTPSGTAPNILPNRSDAKAGIGADAAGDVSIIVDNAGTATEVIRSIGTGALIRVPAVGTGTPAASLCIDSSNNIIKKTTTGACI
jgi:hypothetical protein